MPGHVRELARTHTEEAVAELARLAMKAKSETARVMAINSLLDRGWGKATQQISGEDGEAIDIKVTIGGDGQHVGA